jgi:DNA invertase Pin-like site-specific DNA recombinase
MTHPKVKTTHLDRKAVIYVRQSSLQQVEHHLESQRRQYQQVELAQALGWSEARCEIIDDDQAISGSQSYNRPGYQRLVSMLALQEVGIIVGLEVARLARNSLDWYQMLELAAVFNVLVADEDGVYDLNDFNDRVLLGLKGMFAEIELYHIRARLVGGRLNKARRGEFQIRLPIGLDWDADASKPRLAVDQSVRDAIALVFHLFRQLRSMRGVLHYLKREGLELPYQRQQRGVGRIIRWRRPYYDAIRSILTNPVYAGVYCFGKRERRVNPIQQTVHVRQRPREEWDVFLPDNHPGYITLSEFEENQRIIANNAYKFPQSQGAVRRGPALLQGLVVCQHCGHNMRVRYSKGEPYYTCDLAHRRYGEAICNRASARRVDALVEELFLTVVNAGTLDLSVSHDEQLRQEADQVDRGWQQKLQRLEYEANLARRRYEAVDPDNRLVAQTLETEWNQKLLALEDTRKVYNTQRTTAFQLTSTLEQMQDVVTHLRDYWFTEHITPQDKKEMLRCLIEQVFLESRGKVIHAQVQWYGGATSELDVPKYLFSSPHIYHRVRELAREYTDHKIAELLNQEGLTTVKNKSWTPRRVMDFRLSNAIPSGFTTNADLRIPNTGYITSAEAAQQLGVNVTTIQKWYKWGILPGQQDGPGMPLWIKWNDDVMHRLNGGATPDPRMISVRSLCMTRNQRPDAIYVWACEQGHQLYRLRRGTALRFFVLPHEASTPPE